MITYRTFEPRDLAPTLLLFLVGTIAGAVCMLFALLMVADYWPVLVLMVPAIVVSTIAVLFVERRLKRHRMTLPARSILRLRHRALAIGASFGALVCLVALLAPGLIGLSLQRGAP